MTAKSADVSRAADLLRVGELVAFPTETVYGLGADARNPLAIARIFAAKGRPADHPLIVHLPDSTHLERWAVDIPGEAGKLAAAFWPGPLTLILRRHGSVLDAVTGGQDSVGLRVPDHPLALKILREFDGGVAAPSANRFGRISPTTAAHVREELGDAVAMIIDGGPCAVGIESTIVDLSEGAPTILRPGILSAGAIGAVLGYCPVTGGSPDAPRVSGSMETHYAPRTPLRVVKASDLADTASKALRAGMRIAVLAARPLAFADEKLAWYPASTDPAQFAHDLYARLRELDGLACDLLIIAAPPAEEAWRAVADRLRRASAGAK
jgi:L-threonylcarbamoyladenylate synthase